MLGMGCPDRHVLLYTASPRTRGPSRCALPRERVRSTALLPPCGAFPRRSLNYWFADLPKVSRSWSSSSAIRLRPHRSGQAAFLHPALPGSYPHRAALGVQGGVIRGVGRGKRAVRAWNQSQPMVGSSGFAASPPEALETRYVELPAGIRSGRASCAAYRSSRNGRAGCWNASGAARRAGHASAATPPGAAPSACASRVDSASYASQCTG